MKYIRLQWAGHVATMNVKGHKYIILLGKPLKNGHLEEREGDARKLI
jgi:hypothetical protein